MIKKDRPMKTNIQTIPQATLTVFAKSFFKETVKYGFQQIDYLRFVNLLLDMSIDNNKISAKLNRESLPSQLQA